MGLDHQWQSDLVEMQPWTNKNDNYRYILTVVDLLSRYAFARPLQRKTPEQVIEAFQSIFQEEGRKPRFLQTDQGKEFENRPVRKFLDQHGIEQFSVKSPFNAALVERFNRTLKEKMWRYLTYKNTERWVDVLHKHIKGYNLTHHRIIGRAPASVNAENAMDI
jgi:IS30 family transposase